ncbi:hypothetical protein GUITHDRAFT_156831 [Guillardia theta CCMP2712]|uniref:tRNA-dihydrouridine(16/17) synthase [NAD(P)(+)] n=1 Tax=Guillardia theta (strain CCMP2712) TaxID=905079 RepID=L1K309_GUITC|nr:hypothetical protein GUITHDRAFT_156831 [Guillardia theta CCMP2712]EKX54972.1 hypothetical protein GUITHDRAFT_156831 [Guillardia theta CCMP2712]|eukprot:XP_005841952.1 hypothetical protein GUITHDRAFT_156831 [Guillardia theta CCMP2712]
MNLGFPILLCAAPMVVHTGSCPFLADSLVGSRILTRRWGASLAYSEMLFSERIVEEEDYLAEKLQSCMEDRPLIVQICGNDPSIMARAACLIEDFCNNKSHGVDAIDINLGCPQKRAAEGHYGSYLLEKKDWKLVQEIVESMSKSVNIPISCKIRLLQTESQTVEFAKLLEAAGCSLLAVHGRQRRHGRKGPADLDQIAAVKRALTIPVIANGNVRSPEDIWINLEKTRADGIMSAEGLLANPAIFKVHEWYRSAELMRKR